MKRFTDQGIRSLKPKPTPYDLTEGDGFSIRVQPSKTKTFYFVYTDAGKKQRIRIGEYGTMSLADAREKAVALHSARKRGDSIKQESKTIDDLAGRYLKEHSEKKNTPRVYKENQRCMAVDILPFIGSMDMNKVTRKHVYDLVQRIIDRGSPIQSNKVLKVIRTMFNFGIQCGLTEINPAHMMAQQPDREKTRVLSDKELKDHFFPFIRSKQSLSAKRCLSLILTTGQRPGECLHMQHEEIDGDWWIIPKLKTKNKHLAHAADHRVFLSPLAKEIIGSGAGPVFTSPVNTTVLAALLARFCTRTKIDPFTPHDLRRTTATGIAELGFSQDAVDIVLGHTTGKIARTYNRYSYDKEKTEIMLAWGEKLKKVKP